MMEKVVLEDESLRDGLQFEQEILPLERKIELFYSLKDAGVKRIQVGSFVSPKVVPQMADTEALIAEVAGSKDVLITGLVLNEKGLERAIASGLEHISLSLSVSDTHSRRNVRKTFAEALTMTTKLIEAAVAAGLMVRAGMQCAFGCVYEGEIPENHVVETLHLLAHAGASEFNLADTTGMANPVQIKRMVALAQEIVSPKSLSLHLHDTRGVALANMVAGFDAGVRIFDTSAGGLGGCPFVKGAAGNIATEDAVHLFTSMGVATGIDLEKICAVGARYEELFQRRLPARMGNVLKSLQGCSV